MEEELNSNFLDIKEPEVFDDLSDITDLANIKESLRSVRKVSNDFKSYFLENKDFYDLTLSSENSRIIFESVSSFYLFCDTSKVKSKIGEVLDKIKEVIASESDNLGVALVLPEELNFNFNLSDIKIIIKTLLFSEKLLIKCEEELTNNSKIGIVLDKELENNNE